MRITLLCLLLIASSVTSYGQVKDVRHEYTYYNFTYLLEKPGLFSSHIYHNRGLEYPYIIHLADTMVKLSKVEYDKTGDQFALKGTVSRVSSTIKDAYTDLLDSTLNESCRRCRYTLHSTSYPYAGQTHIFLDSTAQLSDGELIIQESQVTKYQLYKILQERQRENLTDDRRKSRTIGVWLGVSIPTTLGVIALLIASAH